MNRFHRFVCLGAVPLGFCGWLSAPAQAQTTLPPNMTSLSDSSGPFQGNITVVVPPTVPPGAVNTTISTLDNTARDILLLPPELQVNTGGVLKVCVHLSESMAKLAPFSGCSNVNWKAYNRAVSDAKQLNRELVTAVRAQRTALGASPTPEERDLIVRRLELMEKTTTALESTANVLTILGRALDKAR